MAGNKDLVYSFRINTDEAKGKIPEVMGEAKTSTESLRDEFGRFKGAADGAAAGVKGLGDEEKKLPPVADELSQAMQRAEAAVKRLSNPDLSPRALQMAVVAAAVATDRLKDAMATAQKSGGPIAPDAVAKVKAYEEATSKAADQSARYRDALGDQRARSDQAAKGAEALAGSMSSVEGVLGQLKNQTGATSQVIGELGFKVVAAAAAFKLGYDAATKVREVYQELTGKEMPNLSKWFAELVTGANKYTDAEARAGVITQSRLSQMHAKNQAAARELELLDKLIPGLTNEARAAQAAVTAHDQLKLALERMGRAGQDVNDWAVVNAKVIYEALEPAVKAGKLAIEDMSKAERLAYETGKAMTDGHVAQKKALDDLTKSVGENLLKIRERAASEKMAADSMISDAYRSRDAQIKALNESGLSGEAYNKRKREIVAESARIVAEGNEKEIAANAKLKTDIADLATKTEGGADAVKNLGNMYVESQAKKAATLAQDEALKGLTDALVVGTDGLTKKLDESTPAWDGLAKDLGKVKEPAKLAEEGLGKVDGKLLDTGKSAKNLSLVTDETWKAFELLGKKLEEQHAPMDRIIVKLDSVAKACERVGEATKLLAGAGKGKNRDDTPVKS